MDYEKLMQDVIEKKVKLELMIDKTSGIGTPSISNESGYIAVAELKDDEKYRVLLKRGEDIYYLENEYCADIQQSGSCNYRYEKLYKLILKDSCNCSCDCK